MACAVCEHCDSTIRVGEGAIHDGYSYHDRCKKCYVCSETNLHNAEVFKGVLFCSGCSRRIFKGCSAARRVKTKGKRHSNRLRKRRPRRLSDRVIELARLNSALTSDSHTENSKLSAKMFASPTKLRKKSKNHRRNENKKNIYSDLRMAELGASTEIAHVALRRRSEVPVIIQSESALQKASSKRMSYITQQSETSGDHCTDSDYSKEMVKMHWMDRRFRSIMKLPYQSFKKNILTRSSLVDLSSENGKGCIVGRFKNLFYQDVTEHQRRGLKRLYSTINRKKTPYKLGWLEILAKIPESTGSNEYQAREKGKAMCKKLEAFEMWVYRRMLRISWRDRVRNTTVLQRMGKATEILTTIKRRKLEYFGHVMRNTKKYELLQLNIQGKFSRCKHFRTSHSYRCMRSQVMKSAGPTSSELAVLRTKLKNFIFCDFLRNILNFNKQFVCMMTSQACK
ncbi:uncharacterized protein LOC123668152 [Melitaea cinxia]|uniref:uncharacterized protein LOC123668152 n=1 Tax=Melitaea cinxia TaxID=113334 RepID=UPI001E2725C4|nr:uncharacterized protein LOC123668152 [Melitaea cinxia]